MRAHSVSRLFVFVFKNMAASRLVTEVSDADLARFSGENFMHNNSFDNNSDFVYICLYLAVDNSF